MTETERDAQKFHDEQQAYLKRGAVPDHPIVQRAVNHYNDTNAEDLAELLETFTQDETALETEPGE